MAKITNEKPTRKQTKQEQEALFDEFVGVIPPTTGTQGVSFGDDLFAQYEDTEEHLNILYWGREGSGKTINVASATQLGRVLIINAEGGLKKRALLQHGVQTENLVVFPRPGQPLTYDTLEQALYRVKADLMDDPKSWALVAIDSLTELNQAFTDEASEDRLEKQKRRNSNWVPTVGDTMFTDIADYGTSTKMMRKIVRIMRDLPVHTAFTALERRDVDEDTSKVAYGPAVGPALQTSLLGYVDLVLYCKAADEEKPHFRALTKKIGTARAKDRIGVIPTVLIDPTVVRILGYNDGTLQETTDPVQQETPADATPTADEQVTKPKNSRTTRPSRAKAQPVKPTGEDN